MNTLIRSIAAVSTAALLAAAPALCQADKVAKVVADYTVFVDPPTGFVFVKLPAGWKFVGKVEAAQLGSLPATVVTALLSGDDENDEMSHLALGQPR